MQIKVEREESKKREDLLAKKFEKDIKEARKVKVTSYYAIKRGKENLKYKRGRALKPDQRT